VTVKVNAPAAVGVPDKTPAADKLKPVGKFPAVLLNVKELFAPLAVMVCGVSRAHRPGGQYSGGSLHWAKP